MKALLTGLFMIVLAGPVSAQNDTTDIKETVLNVFDGMREADSAKVSRSFARDAKMMTVFTDKHGNPIRFETQLKDFLKFVAEPHSNLMDERILSVAIKIDEHLAQVWTEYEFYAGKQFIHKGVNAFHLIRQIDGSWKIIHITDTRRGK